MTNDISKVIDDLQARLVVSNDIKDIELISTKIYKACLLYYDYLETQEKPFKTEEQVRLCTDTCSIVLRKLNESIIETKDNIYKNSLFTLYENIFNFSGRKNLINFLLALNKEDGKAFWKNTIPIMKGAIKYCQEFILYDKLDTFILAIPPGCGKSYLIACVQAWELGQNINASHLYLSFSQEIVERSVETAKGIIGKDIFKKIFPFFNQPEKTLYAINQKAKMKFKQAKVPANLLAVTINGQITGKRARTVMLDDTVKDGEEASNLAVHEKYRVRFYECITSRKTDEGKLKKMFVGTMWHELDLINHHIDKYEYFKTEYKYTEISESGTCVKTVIPAINENGESVFAHIHTLDELQEAKENMPEYKFMATYQQDCMAQAGLDFAYSLLRTYDEYPKEQGVVRASLDPSRKGLNYTSMPIIEEINGNHYLKDFLYKKGSPDQMYDLVVEKIIHHKICKLIVEINTETSLKLILERKLADRNYFGCIITPVYSTKKKETRIMNSQGIVRDKIHFPKKGVYGDNTDIGLAIKHITNYSFERPNKYDDSIDSIGLYIDEFLKEKRNSKVIIMDNFLKI